MRRIKKNFVLMLISILLCSFSNAFANIYACDHSDIMRKANKSNPYFASSRVYDIALLTSHDALSCDITENSPVNPYNTSLPKGIRDLELAKKIIKRYAKAQADSIGKQLQLGVRYIDARITCVGGIYYTYHEVLSTKLDKCLKEIIDFLIDNPGEFIVFDIAAYRTDEKSENDLAEYISSVQVERGGKNYSLYDFINYDTNKDFASITYNDVTNNGSKAGVVIVEDSSFFDTETGALKVTNPSYSGFFKYKEKHDTWHNKASSSELLSEIDSVANDYLTNKYDGFRCNQVQTTPDTCTFLGSIAGANGSLLSDAETHNLAAINHSHFDYWMSVMPVVWFDYVTNQVGDFNNRINEKILEYNSNLNLSSGDSATYFQITSEDQLKDDMKIFLRESFTANAFMGDSLNAITVGSFKASCFDFNKYSEDQFWILVKSGEKWKIQLPDGTYLKKKGICLSDCVETTDSKDSATDFIINFCDDGNVTIYKSSALKYGMNVVDSRLNLTANRFTKFTLYTTSIS